MIERPVVSVIVTTYTMERYQDMLELLSSLQAQTFRDFEILLILEKSQELYDKLQAFVQEKGYANTRLFFNSGPGGLSYARNIGVKNARGEILSFIDDDALASPTWLQEIVRTFSEDTNAVGLTGPIIPRWQSADLQWMPEEFYWIYSCMYPKWQKYGKVRNAWGTNMSFRREAFVQAGGFSENLGIKGSDGKGWNAPGAEDTDFSVRVTHATGKYIIYNPEIKIEHKVYLYRNSWRFIARRSVFEGCSKSILKRINKNQSRVLANENRLLKHILLRLIPRILSGFRRSFVDSSRKLAVTVVVLSCVAYGYSWGLVKPLK
jgi:glycosyltransferase involved in cell wall biosynthesis